MMLTQPIYKQSAVIPYQLNEGAYELLLIRNNKNTRWVIPKGLLEPDMTSAESAVQEAWEEAGIKGKVSEKPIGNFLYRKWGGVCHVEVYVLEVTEMVDTWLEDTRQRQWFSLEDAPQQVREDGLQMLMRQLPSFMEG